MKRLVNALVLTTLVHATAFVPSTFACDRNAPDLDDVASYEDSPLTSSCPPIETTSPFTRRTSTPVFTPGGCFGVTKTPSGYLLLLTHSAAGGDGFYSATSADGITWSGLSAAPVINGTGPFYSMVKCPEPRYYGTNDMRLYCRAEDCIGFANSTDNGATWSSNLTKVLCRGNPGDWDYLFDMPSVLDTGVGGPRRYVMAYYGQPDPTTTLNGEIGVAFSPDGLNWRKYAGNPVVRKEATGWMSTLVGRPRLEMSPVTGEIYMFFTAGRTCTRIGFATSSDGGATWNKRQRPVLEGVDPDGTWDDRGIYACSLTEETILSGQPVLRMYYIGHNSAGQITGIGYAQGRWAGFPGWTGSESPTRGDLSSRSDLAVTELEAALAVDPNPFSTGTSIQLARSIRKLDGELSLAIYDVSGREVTRLWSGPATEAPERIDWSGASAEGASIASGRYLVALQHDRTTLASRWVTLTR